MLVTAIGVLFICSGILWAVASYLLGGMSENRTTWRDTPWQVVFSVPIILIGIAIVWR